jgi:integrase
MDVNEPAEPRMPRVQDLPFFGPVGVPHGLRAVAKERVRQRVLRPEELRAVWKAAERLGGPAGDAYRLLILSGQRKSQVTLARLEHFDMKEGLWTIPAEQEGSKNDTPHVLPITIEIEAIVKACPHRRGYLFSTTMGAKPLTLGAKIKRQIDALALEELKREAVPPLLAVERCRSRSRHALWQAQNRFRSFLIFRSEQSSSAVRPLASVISSKAMAT